MNLDAPRAQRCCCFKADEACTDDDDPLCTRSFGDQIATIVECAQIMDVRQIGARNIQVHRISSGRDEKCIECDAAAVRQRDGPFDGIDRHDARAQPHVDLLLRVKVGRAQRNPILGGRACEIILRQIGPVIGQGVIGAQNRHAAAEAVPTEHLCGRISGSAAANDNDGLQQMSGFSCLGGFGSGSLSRT